MSRILAGVLVMLTVGLATAQAATRTWTDISAKRSIEAELVELIAGKVRLQKSDGKTIVLPLDRLSEADRKYVEARNRGSEPAADAPKKTPAEWLAGLKVQARVQWDDVIQIADDGRAAPRGLVVVLELTGPAAAQASAVGNVTLKTATDSRGEPLPVNDSASPMDDVRRAMLPVDRSDNLFSRHPHDGLRIPLAFVHPPAVGDRLKAVAGTVMLRTAGRRQEVVEERVAGQNGKTVQDVLLKEAGLEVRFRTQPKGSLVVDVRGKMDRLAGIRLTDGSGRSVEAASSRTADDKQGQYQFDCPGLLPASAQLRIDLHLDAEHLEVPFALGDLPVPAEPPPVDFQLKADAR